jgi:hypothetical protein
VTQPVFVTAGIASLVTLWGLAAGESPNLTVLAGCVTVLTVQLLWKRGEPTTLLLLAALHLIQVETALVYANILGVHINSLSEFGVDLERATAYALLGVLSLVIGMSYGSAGPRIWSEAICKSEVGNWEPRSAFRFFCITLVLESVFTELSQLSDGLRQFFLAGAGVQWIGVFLLAYVCLVKKRGQIYLVAAVLIEVALGFTGFFGGFKTVFLVLFVAFAAARPRIDFSAIIAICVAASIALLLTVFWSEIKTDYRRYLNQGSQSQVVLVPLEERAQYLYDRANEAGLQTLASGFDKMLRRTSYVEFFGASLSFVPESRQHENGGMTSSAFSHIFLPRILFPDKPPLPSDSIVTIAYTGLPISRNPGTSISIGYAGELYIDFGIYGMIACMGILGVFYGLANRFVQKHCQTALVGYGATFAALAPGFFFETSLPKTIGGVCTAILITVVLSRFVLPFALKALASQHTRERHLLRKNHSAFK